MSHNTLNQALTSQSLSGSQGNMQTMVTSAQVMQFLGSTVQQGGSNGMMAQDVLQLMQQQPTAVANDVTHQLTPVVQLTNPRENQVASALTPLCTRYESQIAQLQMARQGRAAGNELAKQLQTLPGSQTPQGRQLIRQLQQGKVAGDSDSARQLGALLKQASEGDGAAKLPQLLKQLAKSSPQARTQIQKALSHEESMEDDEKVSSHPDKNDTRSAAAVHQEMLSANDQKTPLIGQRDGQQQQESQQQLRDDADEKEDDDEIALTGVASASVYRTSVDTPPVSSLNTQSVPVATRTVSSSPLSVQLVCPAAVAMVSEARAEHAVRHILQNHQVSLSGLVQAPLDSLLLQAATLGLKTFSNTADATARSIKINGDAQARLTDKKVADYKKQLDKAQEQEQKSQKAKFWSAIFSPITKLFNAIFKPIVDLIKKIPGMEQVFNWVQKNISEIALPLAIISSLVCPMSLPMTLGLLTVTTAAAGFSIANKIMGDKAPAWLKVTDQVGDMLAGIAIMCAVGNMINIFGKIGRVGKYFERIAKRLDSPKEEITKSLQHHSKAIKNYSAAIQSFTSIGDGVSQYVIGSQQAHLQKELGDIEASLGLDEMQASWLKSAQNNTVSNLENIINRTSAISESASQAISEIGSLRARLANSIV